MSINKGVVDWTGWTVITDLDGTIIDSEAMNFAFLDQILIEFDLMEQKETILKGLAEGKDFDDIMKDLDLTLEKRTRMESRMRSLLTQAPTPSLPGVHENLSWLRGLGILFGIATDNYYQFVDKVIMDLQLTDVFDRDLIITNDRYPHRKPSSKIVSEILHRSKRKNAIIIGNTPKEIALARNSDCHAIIIRRPSKDSAKDKGKKDSIEYEWDIHGGYDDSHVHIVEDWDDVKRTVMEIIEGRSGGLRDRGI